MWNLKRNNTNDLTYKRGRAAQTYRMNLWLQGEAGEGRDTQGVWDGHVHTAMFKMDSQQGPTV